MAPVRTDHGVERPLRHSARGGDTAGQHRAGGPSGDFRHDGKATAPQGQVNVSVRSLDSEFGDDHSGPSAREGAVPIAVAAAQHETDLLGIGDSIAERSGSGLRA